MNDVCHVSGWHMLSFRLIVCMCMSKCMGVWYELLLVDMYHCSLLRHTLNFIHPLATGLHSPLFMTCCCKVQPWMCEMCFALSWVHSNSRARVTSLPFYLLVHSSWDTFLYFDSYVWVELNVASHDVNSHVDYLSLFLLLFIFCVDLYCSYVIINEWKIVSFCSEMCI